MGFLGRLLRTLLLLGFIAAIASGIAAFLARDRMTSKGQPEDDEIDLVAIFDSLDFSSTAPAFRRASYTAWYGGGTLDLRRATLDPAGASLTLRAVFGGFRLVVPATWRVELNTISVFGGIGDTRDHERIETDGPVLRIDGFAIFGGIGIVSDAPDMDGATEMEAEPAPTPA